MEPLLSSLSSNFSCYLFFYLFFYLFLYLSFYLFSNLSSASNTNTTAEFVWELLATFENLWKLMAILGNSRQLLAIFENFRQPFENLCQPMATYVNFWQFFERILSFHSYPTWCKNSKKKSWNCPIQHENGVGCPKCILQSVPGLRIF